MFKKRYRVIEMFHLFFFSYFSPPIDDFDIFKELKDQNFFESQESVIALCTHLQELRKTIEDLDENQLKNEFLKVLQVNIMIYIILIF